MAAAETVMQRLARLHPRLIDLSLGRIERLLARLGHPERRLPPVIHVAGTNGKGSVCAFLRAIGEAAGLRVHVYTSPHLVTFHERIRLAGRLVDDAALTEALETCERANGEDPITVFEIATAAAFLLFAAEPADLLVLEVGLGGRLDATNVIDRPAACAITAIGMDHMEFLGDTIERIAFEKAGILKPGVPAVTGQQDPRALAVIAARAETVGAPLAARGRDWTIAPTATGLRYEDRAGGLDLPPPALPGVHQHDNAGIAVAAMRAVADPRLTAAAIAAGIARAEWPARLQRLTRGPLVAMLPPGWSLTLDGGHNPDAGRALGIHLATVTDRPWHVIVGMKRGKGTAGFLAPILPHAASLWAVAEPDQHLAQAPEEIVAASGGAARIGPRVADALAAIIASADRTGNVLICGSLYLAGVVLRENG
ncbi:folylpolyglutamate synthase/dihydrofolate synthase family protein [Elioraea sp.]|uniref:bifunctional folylpolyglutamate synthase/dihydrofolate synthase n=1 Tax=Elioraea sp. TaxID=2185103 RepID=UPI0021DE93AB|nr:folylpolyglutamate synthase/dihydrofolate synthase family protein [Elioraea sp.]GIX08891.1 MAG: bifunctional folylpolyglutamate synthase/dihydrofolate synthase [Elioraea sp.]